MKTLHRCLPAAIAALWLHAPAVRAAADPLEEFISPVSNPVNFEDPRIESDVRPIFVYHKIDDRFLDVVRAADLRPPGGDAKVVAAQIRIKLGERLALIATKDGYVWADPDHDIDNVVKSGHGFANIAAGLKYNFFRDVELPALASAGIRYEAPSGEPQGLQGSVFRSKNALGLDLHDRGKGILNLFASGAWAYRDLHLVGYTGPRLALDGVDSSFYDTSLHVDYKIGSFYPLFELNWIYVLDGGDRLKGLEKAGLEMDEEGFDFFNLGAPSAGGNSVATAAFGARWRILEGLETFAGKGGVDLGAVFELPVTSRRDLFDWRVTTDLIFWVL